jgi:hypothetical protein
VRETAARTELANTSFQAHVRGEYTNRDDVKHEQGSLSLLVDKKLAMSALEGNGENHFGQDKWLSSKKGFY